jgi:hypothetical protein
MKIIDDVVVRFANTDCLVAVDIYSCNDRISLTLTDINDSANDIVTATVNIPNEPLEFNEVFIKNWSENSGVTEALQRSGVIGRVLDTVDLGFVFATKHELLI